MDQQQKEKEINFTVGVLLALLTSVLWGVLPIFLKMALLEISPGTIAWFRFTFAFFLLISILSLRGRRPMRILIRPPGLGLLAGASLAGNYIGVTLGVQLSSPSNVGVLIQVAPLALVLVGVAYFNERLNRLQVWGLILAGIGFSLFYLDRTGQLSGKVYSIANAYILFGAGTWVAYMVCQKVLSQRYEAQSLNLLVYGVASVVLIPWVAWSEFSALSGAGWGLLVFLGLNTLLAYGALAEAVKRIPLTLISIIISLNPLVTLLGMWILPGISSGWLAPENIGWIGYCGAAVAVTGAVIVLSRKTV